MRPVSVPDKAARRWCHDERLARAAWSRITEPSDVVADALRRHLGVGEALAVALELTPPPSGHLPGISDTGCDLAAALRRWAVRAAVVDPERDVATMRGRGGGLLVPGDPQWPAQVDDLGLQAPVCLWVRGRGDLAALTADSVALVGSRNSTRYGEGVAEDFAVGLSRHDLTVVSGAALGIDAAAHRGCLAARTPTVAVLACGVDRNYPLCHDVLLDKIARTGVVVSELPPGCTPTRVRFLERNRLIAALTAGTVVVEAGWRSGARNTANWATFLNRRVMAVPGPVTSPVSSGCHRLVRDGARLVTDVTEVLEELRPIGEAAGQEPLLAPRPYDTLTRSEQLVWEGLHPVHWLSVAQVAVAAGLDEPLTTRILDRLSIDKRARSRATAAGAVWRRGQFRP